MKQLKTITIGISLLIFCILISGCQTKPVEKDFISITTTKEKLYKQDLISRAEIIIEGKVVSKNFETMTNPDGTALDSSGKALVNCQIAEYTVQINEKYKGDYNGDTINVMTYNGYGLNSDLILYGEDEKSILETPLERVDLEVGQDCILLLQYVDDVCEGYDGYYPVANRLGYYPKDQNGNYTCDVDVEYDNFSFSSDTVKQELSALQVITD